MEVILTNHAIMRGRERCNFKRNTLERIALKAITNPNKRKDLRLYLEGIERQNTEKEVKSFVYGDYIYIFIDNKLQTVYDAPKYIRRNKDELCIWEKFKRKTSNMSSRYSKSNE